MSLTRAARSSVSMLVGFGGTPPDGGTGGTPNGSTRVSVGTAGCSLLVSCQKVREWPCLLL